jgi:hypothetical protein
VVTCNATEQWRPVADKWYASAYRVSNHGRVLSVRSNRILSPSRTPKGYMVVSMSVRGIQTACSVHRLVAYAWLSRPLEGQDQLNHKNGIKDDNRAENLERPICPELLRKYGAEI